MSDPESEASVRAEKAFDQIATLVRDAGQLPHTARPDTSSIAITTARAGAMVSACRNKRTAACEEASSPPAPAVSEPILADTNGGVTGAGEVTWPPGYTMTPGGLTFAYPGSAETPRKICGPFQVLGQCRTLSSQSWGLVLCFDDPDCIKQTIVIPMRDLAGDTNAVHKMLASRGLALVLTRAAKDKLIEALASVQLSKRVRLVDRIGWNPDRSFYALPNKTFGHTDPVIVEGADGKTRFDQSGSLDEWHALIGAYIKDHDILLFFVALAFAGPLLDPLGAESGGFHLVGKSSSGKTTALSAAASVWGSPDFIGTWRATSNGFEAVAANRNDNLYPLDEMGVCDSKDVAEAVYALGGGCGKSRMTSGGELRADKRWRIIIASTGEVTLAEKVTEAGNGVKPGQLARLVDIGIDPARVSGVFDGAGTPEYFATLANLIKANAATIYGTAGPAFVEKLVKTLEETTSAARCMISQFVKDNVGADADGQVARVAARFALVAAAGETAAGWGILPVAQGTVTTAASRLFEAWVGARGGTGASEDRQAIVRVRDFLEAHGSRFDVKGKPANPRSLSLPGFRDNEYFYINESGMKEALGGLNIPAAANALRRAGFLTKGDGRHIKCQVTHRGVRHRVYKMSVTILEWDDGV